MRFNGKELAAVALQPSHKFDKEGVLLIKEKQDGLFRRGEVDVPRFCRLRGNLLFYFKSTDLCSEPVGVFVLEQCAVSLASSNSEGPYAFHLTFDGDKTVHQFSANTEPERDSWIQVLHMASYQYMCSQLRALQEKLNSLQSKDETSEIQSRMSRTKSMMDSSDEPFLEMSTACDNLLCDGNGTAPNPMLSVSVMNLPQTQWSQYAQTEIIERSSNPCFLTTVGFRTSDNIVSTTKVKVSVYDVRERLTLTMTQLGSTVFTVAQLMEADKNKLRLTLLSADNKTVGFVTVTAWQIESEATSSANASSGSNQDSPQDEVPLEKARSQTLPAKLPFKSRISQHSQLNVLYENAISQTYRFHTGLGADLSVLEIMAENKLSFAFPQALLTIFIKEEKDLLNNITVLGELKPVWNTRQVEEIERHLQLINSYTHALTYLDSYTGPNFKASAMKTDTNLEFVPINLHLQRMWIQNDSTKKSGFYDVMTVGAFTAHSLKFKNGGLLRMINQANAMTPNSSNLSKRSSNGQNKLTRASTIANKIRNLRQEMKVALDRLNSLAARKASGEIQIVMTDITNLAQQVTKLCDPLLIEEAYRILEEVRLPQADGNVVDQSNPSQYSNSSVPLSPARLMSMNSSPVHRPAAEFMGIEDDELEMVPASSAHQDEKADTSKEWSVRKMQHRRSSSDARLYSECNSDAADADRHSLFNVRICEEESASNGKREKSAPSSCSRSPSMSQKLGWRLQKQASSKENGTRYSSSPRNLSFMESNSMFNLLRKAGSRARHERSLINIGRSDSNPDSNKSEEMQSLRKCKKTMSLRSLNGARIRSMSPDEPEPWDLTQLNIEASVMCMGSKVRTLCRHDRNVGIGTGTESQPNTSAASPSTPATRNADWVEELRPSMKKLKQALDCLLKTSRLTHCLFSLQESAEYTALQCLIRYRRDVVFSQALTALVAAILTRLWCHRPDPAFLARLCELGLLIQFEGLLSCYGDEMSMLEDMVVAIDDMRKVKFRLMRCDNPSKVVPEVGGSRTALLVNLPVPDLVLTLLPMECQGTCEFVVTPVFFNIGINEQASFAEKFGDISLQEKINIDGSETLEEFHRKYQALPLKLVKTKKLSFTDYHFSVDKLMEKLKAVVHTRHSKNVEILHIAAEICRQLDGLRFTSCKSAKDRTSMSVTLEQCVILEEQYDLAEPEFSHALDCMRCEGTRRENTLKNAGVMKYAFNSLQLMALPKQYRPPPGTYGNVQT